MDKIELLKQMIAKSNNIVFFGGAGVSTESGIPDFRSKDGLYNQKYKYPPEEILSHSFFKNNTEEFYKFYKDKMNSLKFEPNITHKVLAKLEKEGKLVAIVTQNIDGLHQKAGSKNVYELHGTIYKNYCTKCGKFHGPEDIFYSKDIIPRCDCGGIIKPDVVLYEESLNEDTIKKSVKAIMNAGMLIIGGTSLTVYPAASLVKYYNGNKLVLINKSKIELDSSANLTINDYLGNVFSKLY